MTNTQFKALLHTLKSYHNHLSVKGDAVKIEAWQENGYHLVVISEWHYEDDCHMSILDGRMTHTYCYNEISGQYDLAMID